MLRILADHAVFCFPQLPVDQLQHKIFCRYLHFFQALNDLTSANLTGEQGFVFAFDSHLNAVFHPTDTTLLWK